MTKIKKYSIANLIINLVFTVGGGALLLAVNESLANGDFNFTGDANLEEMGPMSLLVVGLWAAMVGFLVIIPLLHLVVGGFNSLMLLLQVLTGKVGFSALVLLADLPLLLVDGMLVLMALGSVTGIVLVALFGVPLGMAIASFVLAIKAMEARKRKTNTEENKT